MRRLAAFCLLGSVTACNGAASRVSSAQPSAASSTPRASAVAPAPSASAAPLVASALKRNTTPSERFQKDQAACDGGDKEGCRHLADRWSGIGTQAGCGISRGRPAPFVKRLIDDRETDEDAFQLAVGKACDLGDAEACKASAIADMTASLSFHVRLTATRASLPTLGIWAFRSSLKPESAKKIADRRKGCFDKFDDCIAPDSTLFLRDEAPKDGKLPADLAKTAKDACDATHDCGEIYMVLDQDGYSVDELAPMRAAFADTLKKACLDGECTCGNAARFTESSNADRFDLAVLGCENGEAEGCAVLGEYYERGDRIPKDKARAFALYDLACPSIHPTNGNPGEYSKYACDRIATEYMNRPYDVNDRERAMYYATFSCPTPGAEINHVGCVHEAMLWAMKKSQTLTSGMNRSNAISTAAGVGGEIYRLLPGKGDAYTECWRPSVAAECAELEKLLPAAK